MKKVWFFLFMVSGHTMYSAEKKEDQLKHQPRVWAGIDLRGNFDKVTYEHYEPKPEEEEKYKSVPLVHSLIIMRQSNTYCFCPVTFQIEPNILVDKTVQFTLKDAQKFAAAVQQHTQSKATKNGAKTSKKNRTISTTELISFDKDYRLVYTPYQGYPGYASIRYYKKYTKSCSIL